jgi:serine/threonine protein kinase
VYLTMIAHAGAAPLPGTLSHIGQVVDGRYELLSLLSEGGMGRVFKARHRRLDRLFALKLVHHSVMEADGAGERFLREARLASSLNHQNVVAVTDFGHDPELGYFLVMELLEGETLREMMDRQMVGYRVACDIVDQLAGVMRHIHARGILHCDLKPDNIFLVRPDGEPRRRHHIKLIDFGLSWHKDAMAETQVCGTPPYLAPERLVGEQPSPRCDVYSLGMIFYELVAGRTPFFGDPLEIMRQQMEQKQVPPPSDLSLDRVGSPANGLILRALEHDPGLRHASVEAFHYEVRALMEMTGLRVRTPTEKRVIQRQENDALETLMESAVAQALVETSGAVRFASKAFVSLTGGGEAAPQSILDLPGIVSEAYLTDAMWICAETRKAMTRKVTGWGEGKWSLVIAPVLRGNEVDALHLLLLPTA